MPQLRLIRESNFQDGASNMATDCAVFEGVSQGLAAPTLRIYGWNPYCLSLGYGQRVRDVDQDMLQSRGWHLVRRPTGGKAILHGEELTYSLCLPIDHPMAAGTVVDSYRRISAALLIALKDLGLEVESAYRGDNPNSRELRPVCFEISSHYELTVGAKKLVGSAQMRRKAGILQHGTIPLWGDVGRICDVLAFESEQERESQRQRVRQRAVTLEALTKTRPSWDRVADALEDGFRDTLDAEIDCANLSRFEQERAKVLMEERFANAKWIAKR